MATCDRQGLEALWFLRALFRDVRACHGTAGEGCWRGENEDRDAARRPRPWFGVAINPEDFLDRPMSFGRDNRQLRGLTTCRNRRMAHGNDVPRGVNAWRTCVLRRRVQLNGGCDGRS